MKRRLRRAAAAFCVLMSAMPAAHAGIAIGINVAPPPRRVELVPAHPPHPHWVWIGGHWRRVGGRWIWDPGYWARPPRWGAAWIAGRWTIGPHGWVWVAGRWR